MKIRNSQAGFSLLELMIAVTVLTISICGIAGSTLVIVRGNTFTNDRTRCFKSAHQTMESLLTLEMDDMIQYNGQTFTAIQNREMSTSMTTWAGSMGELDQGTPPTPTYDGEPVDGGKSFEPDTRGAPSTGTVEITDLKWGGLTDKAYQIKITVPEFGVEISAVRTRY